MRVRPVGVVAVTILLLSACAPQSPARSTATPAAAPPPNSIDGLAALYAPYSATYRTAAGDTWALSLQGLLVNLRSGMARDLAPEGHNKFTVGPSVGETTPPDGEVSFKMCACGKAIELDGHGGATGDFIAPRLPYTEREVHFLSGKDTFGATLTEPAGGTNLPAIALVHGSGVQPRPLFSLWANFYASLGFAVLNYDKRGTGESGGSYPGEFPTNSSLSIYADDAIAAARFLRSLPEVDKSRVGFHGGSQGGWTVPLALSRAPEMSFAILVSAPTVGVEETVFYKDLSGGSAYVPTISDAEQDAQTRAVTGGYDPAPALAALHVPTLWIYGEKDRQVPVRLSIEKLHQLAGKDLTIKVQPGGWHGLTETPNGLAAEEITSKRFAQGLFTDMADWTKAHGLTSVSL